MKTLFREYFYPSDTDIKEVWNDALIVFDTCALLNLYRYTEKTRESFIKILEAYKDRLWIPYQVAKEFLQDKKEVIKSQEKAYDEINKGLNDTIHNVENIFNKYKKHVVIDSELFKNKIKESIENIKSELQETRSKLPLYDEKDDLLEAIISIFENKVGIDFSETELNKLYKEGENRYKEEIPPGYKDEKQKKSLGNRHLYGDLIVWKQIIKKASDDKRNIIFVTDDQKEDWWVVESGKTLSPRLELYKEFFAETGQQRILIYKADSFLYHSNQYMKDSPNKIDESSIKEVKNLSSVPSYAELYANIKELNDKYGIDILSKSNTSIVDSYLKDKYLQLNGEKIFHDYCKRNQYKNSEILKMIADYASINESHEYANILPKYIYHTLKKNNNNPSADSAIL